MFLFCFLLFIYQRGLRALTPIKIFRQQVAVVRLITCWLPPEEEEEEEANAEEEEEH